MSNNKWIITQPEKSMHQQMKMCQQNKCSRKSPLWRSIHGYHETNKSGNNLLQKNCVAV